VAEGIEDRATHDLLTELGCDIAQGYFIGMPVPAESLVLDVRIDSPGNRALVS
jgi:EAL domain-containing protein (putative c-di-GMP-specific phosphodiesterase class I)